MFAAVRLVNTSFPHLFVCVAVTFVIKSLKDSQVYNGINLLLCFSESADSVPGTKEGLWESQGRHRQARLLGTFLFSSEVLRSIELFFIIYLYLPKMLWKVGHGWAVVHLSLGPGP